MLTKFVTTILELIQSREELLLIAKKVREQATLEDLKPAHFKANEGVIFRLERQLFDLREILKIAVAGPPPKP